MHSSNCIKIKCNHSTHLVATLLRKWRPLGTIWPQLGNHLDTTWDDLVTTWLHLETEWITLGHHLETRWTPQEHQLEQHSALCTLCTAHIPLPSQAPRPTWWWVHKWAVEPDYPILCGHFVLKTNTLNSMVWLFMFYWQIFTNIVHYAYLWIEPPGYFMPPTPSLPMPLLSSGGKEAKQVNVRRVLFHTVPHSATLFHIVQHCVTLCHILPH